jgi:hypothetical protein
MLKLKQRFKEFCFFVVSWLVALQVFMPGVASADGSIAPVDVATLSTKIVTTLNTILIPLGSLFIFISIAIAAFKIILTANKPQERAEAMTSLPYIVGGGILLGCTLMFSGFVLSLMTTVST